jgi:hypothetical protein
MDSAMKRAQNYVKAGRLFGSDEAQNRIDFRGVLITAKH